MRPCTSSWSRETGTGAIGARWVDEVTDHKVADVRPHGNDAQLPEMAEQFEYRQFDVRARGLSIVLTEWGKYGWRCHTQSPNKTPNGQPDGTVWVLLERTMG